jgi:transcriptional regulator of arginine metabolism
MKERDLRMRSMRKIIETNRIESQDRLQQLLSKEGFNVTQATLSRDLKLLKVGKVSQGVSGYFYTVPSEEDWREGERSYAQDFLRGYVSIDFSGNVGVIRTLTGHAGSVALALDCLGLETILGTVAGDDTIMVVLREGVTSQQFMAELRERIPDVEE